LVEGGRRKRHEIRLNTAARPPSAEKDGLLAADLPNTKTSQNESRAGTVNDRLQMVCDIRIAA
jgi:hypothetical protein